MSLQKTNLALTATVEATFDFSGDSSTNIPNVIKLTNAGTTLIEVLLDQTVTAGKADAYQVPANSEITIVCDGCTVLHAISTADGTLTIDEMRRFKPLQIETLVANTEKITLFNGTAKKVILTNRGTGDAYFAFDNVATKGTGTEEFLEDGATVERDVTAISVHLISAGTPKIEVRAAER
jgi:hypothetical protein